MKLKKKGVYTREEIAQYLTRLAGMVADGQLIIDNMKELLGDEMSFRLEIKKKKGNLEIELYMKARSPSEKKWIHIQKGESAEIYKGRRPHKAKQIKKAMGAVWKEFMRTALEGDVKSSHSVREKLLELMDAYDVHTEDAWRKEWARCKKEVTGVIEALEGGDLTTVSVGIEAVNDAIRRCHKRYK